MLRVTRVSALLGAMALDPAAGADPAVLEPPWQRSGWTAEAAAGHLLDRFAYGARPGDIERVVAIGVEAWFEQQLRGALPEPELARRMADLDAWGMEASEIQRTFPNPGLLLRRLERDPRAEPATDSAPRVDAAARREMRAVMEAEGLRPQRELLDQYMAGRVLRAVYAENQLHEVLAALWSNHLYVSLRDPQARSRVLAYERDAIRPHLLGSYQELLAASARHPAMLLYLDNARSAANPGAATSAAAAQERSRQGGRGFAGADRRGSGRRGMAGGRGGRSSGGRQGQGGERPSAGRPGRPSGLNENYARELLELHTLGVDGGYDQQDVIEVARAFSGWSVMPPSDEAERLRSIAGGARARRSGFVVDGDFVFRADQHDAEAKVVLGRRLPAGRGIEDGEEVLAVLAAHPATAVTVAREIAVRFVADDPSAALVDRLAARYLESRGDLAEVMRALLHAPELWDPSLRAGKVKSPFELAVSSVRAVGAEVVDAGELVGWISRMGEPIGMYEAPTGYPDRAEQWLGAGALLSRMSFGLQLATGRVGGVSVAAEQLFAAGEPESAGAALAAAWTGLLPTRAAGDSLAALEPLLASPDLLQRIEAVDLPNGDPLAGLELDSGSAEPGRRGRARGRRPAAVVSRSAPTVDELAVGVILGSPEFQRR